MLSKVNRLSDSGPHLHNIHCMQTVNANSQL